MATGLAMDPPRSTDGSELKLRVLDLDNEHVHFALEGVELGLANALRRTMLADIPTLGAPVGMGAGELTRPQRSIWSRSSRIARRCPTSFSRTVSA